jgi:hypothetical protein
MKNYIFDFILIILNIIPIINIIVLPFEIKSKPKQNLDDVNEYYIYSTIDMGEPSQKINCEINFDISDYFMTYTPKNVEPTFNLSLSKTFVQTSQNRISSSSFRGGFWASDNFYFYTDLNCKNKEKFESVNVVYPPKENRLTACEIGLQSSHSFGKYQNIIHILKSKQITNNYIWTMKFHNLNNGIIVIGAAPHEYDRVRYNESELKYVNTFSDSDKLYWCLYFKYDPVNNFTLSKNIKVRITPKILGIVATYYYLTVVEELYFKKYYEKKVCEKKIFSFGNSNYFKITCSKDDFTSHDIEQFPSLNLHNIAFNYSFVLNGKELFTEEDDKIEFQILIEIGSAKTEWKLGRIFLLKYQIVFDDDNSLIGFYKPNIKENNNNGDTIGMIILKVFILFFVVSVFLFLVFLFYKKISFLTKRKKMANELEDDFMYVPGRNSKNKQ